MLKFHEATNQPFRNWKWRLQQSFVTSIEQQEGKFEERESDRKKATYGATLGEIGDTAGINKKLAKGVENAVAIDAEIEVFVGEDIDDVVDDGLVYVLSPRP